MRDAIRENRKTLKELLDGVIVTNSEGAAFALDQALENSIKMIIERVKAGRKVILIGNGGSAAIASHIAIDFLKNAKIPAMAFNDPALLTCISNDFGYKYVFEKPIEMLTEPGDILIAISSSGQSENILRGVSAAKKRDLQVLTLSGFAQDNPLRGLGDINFYVPSESYGHLEIIHLSICHCLVDIIIEKING